MLEGLRKGDYDIIIALTESLLAGIEKDGGAKLLGCLRRFVFRRV